MSETQLSLHEHVALVERLARSSLNLWDLPTQVSLQLINVSENVTFRVDGDDGFRAILRVHRQGYHTQNAISCELAWLEALRRDTQIAVPGYLLGRDGSPIQLASTPELPGLHFMVMFEFMDGDHPDESGNLTSGFERLGAIAAQCHEHVQNWAKPDNFERLTWDVDAVFGANPTWGNWRHAPNVDVQVRDVLEGVEAKIHDRLTAYGKASSRYNLIHADMRLANVLIAGDDTTLIDFDDCGMGWFMYDFAAAISFIEDDPRVPQMKAAWLRGYRRVRDLPVEDEAEIETFVMLRRMALLAWIGSHIEAPEPQALAPEFAKNTAKLGKAYLSLS